MDTGSMRDVARVEGAKRLGGEIHYPFRRLLRRLWVMVAWLPRLFMGSFRFRPKYLATNTRTPLLSSKKKKEARQAIKVKLCKVLVKWKRDEVKRKRDLDFL